MSALEAAGWALSRSQSVSVVPDDPVPAPRDDEQHALLGPQDQPGRRVDPVLGHDQMDALGRPDVELAALADHRLGVVRPHPGGVDDLLGADLVLPAALHVLHPGADDPLALAQEAGHPRAVGDLRAVRRRGAHQGGHVAGVVHLGVVVLHGADQGVLLQARGHAQGVAAGQMAVHGQAAAVARGTSTSRRRARRPSPRTTAPSPCAARGRGTAPASRGAGRAAPAAGRAPSAPPARARSRASPDSAGRRGSACWTGSRCPTPSPAPRPGRSTGLGSPRPARCPRRPRPRPRPGRPAPARPFAASASARSAGPSVAVLTAASRHAVGCGRAHIMPRFWPRPLSSAAACGQHSRQHPTPPAIPHNRSYLRLV